MGTTGEVTGAAGSRGSAIQRAPSGARSRGAAPLSRAAPLRIT
ncbi:hypothetical protein [Lysobacter gummosus]